MKIKQWVLSFLLVDLVFWLFILGTCAVSPVDCLESSTFGPYFFYLPWSLIPQLWLQNFTSEWISVLSPIPLLILIHAVLGIVVSLVWRKPVRWWVSISFAFIFIFSSAAVFTYVESKNELARETTTQLWAIYDIQDEYIKSTKVEMAPCEGDNTCPNGYRLNFDEGYGEWFTDNKNAEVTLIQCPAEGGCAADYKTTFDDYLAIRSQCQEDPLTCTVYGIGGDYDLFNVTFNSKGILHMEQVYLP